ncbi:MAG: hypothetical protein WCB68_02895, partial [Pyrinomonadaceae bacterium]
LSVNALPTYNLTLDPQEIKEAHRALLQGLCDAHGLEAAVRVAPSNKRNVSGFVIYADRIWGQALKALSNCPVRTDIRSELALPAREAGHVVQQVLRELEALLEEENEPDFMHSPTRDAYDLTRQIIENAYTHYIGSAPIPAIAPDGDGGVIVEWQSDRRIVRLIVPASKDESSYVYSKGDSPSEIDDPATDVALAQRLRTIFAD